MNITETVIMAMEKMGSNVIVNSGGNEKKAKAFVQPLRYKNRTYLSGRTIEPGFYDDHHYLYIGMPTVDFSKDYHETTVTYHDEKYTVERAEVFMVGEKPLYVWAILMPYQAPPEDEYDN